MHHPTDFMRALAALALLVMAAVPMVRAAEGRLPPLPTDARLRELIQEALAARPELQQADALVRVESERVPQAGAPADPVLTVGIQNDGFDGLQIGTMETSYYQAMVTQPFFWPGKRALRTQIAEQAVDRAALRRSRAALSVEGDVRLAYVELVLVRDRLLLLARQEALWEQAEGLARVRYEVGNSPQSDLLRAQLERTRLRQRKLALESTERTRVQALDRLTGRDPGEPLETTHRLADLAEPALPDTALALADAEARSPELLEALLAARQADLEVDLATREQRPDMALSAGVMPRGSLDPMWTLSFSIGLPVWSERKQKRAVLEREASREAEQHGVTAVRDVLRLRTVERLTLLANALEVNEVFRDGLLVQSEGATESALSQYRVGRVAFTSVLEALNGLVADRAAYLDSMARAQRLAIAQWQLGLEPPEAAADESSAGMSAVPGNSQVATRAGVEPVASSGPM